MTNIPQADLDALHKKVASLQDELFRMKAARNDLIDELARERKIRADAVEALLNEKSFFETVVRWHLAMGQDVRASTLNLNEVQRTYSPSLRMGMKLVREEYQELQDAWDLGDMLEAADAIGDLIWVLCGLAARMGFDIDEVWGEITRSNYAKLGGPKREDGKQLKPEGWEPPDIKAALCRGRNLTKL